MKNNNFILKNLLLIFILMTFISCDITGDTDPGGTTVEQMAGDWYVKTSVNGNVIDNYKRITTYNTASNGQEIWIDDNKQIYSFKFKSPVNLSSLTFGGSNLESSVIKDDATTPEIIETYDIIVNVTDGKILKNATRTSGGNVSDSIVFNAEFSDNPGEIYQISGYKRTGFLEDEH